VEDGEETIQIITETLGATGDRLHSCICSMYGLFHAALVHMSGTTMTFK